MQARHRQRPLDGEEDHGGRCSEVEEAGPQGRALAAEHQSVDERHPERTKLA